MSLSSPIDYCLRKVNILTSLFLSGIIAFGFTASSYVLASATSNLTQTITAGTLSVDIVDASYVTVGSPSVAMGSKTFSFGCQSGGSAATGTFGTTTQQIYMKNPNADNNGFVISLAASAPTALWASAGKSYDFNDPTGSGCSDGADADLFAGQMTVNPTAGTLAVGTCLTCGTTSITKGSSSAFSQGTTDSITLLTAAAASDDIGDWKLTGVTLSQTIPAEQPAASDYNINMTLTITGN